MMSDGVSPAVSIELSSGRVAGVEEATLLNPEFHARLRKRLRQNRQALDYLAGLSLRAETVERFGLGLSAPYTSRRSNAEQSDALVYPVTNSEGAFVNKYGYYHIPGVTKGAGDADGWTSGEARTYYSVPAEGCNSIFVCDSPWDVWRNWQETTGRLARDLLFVSSTRAKVFPEEWSVPGFWSRWETVYLGFGAGDIGEMLAAKLATLVERETRRVVPLAEAGGSWAGFWNDPGGGFQGFEELLLAAPFMSVQLNMDDDPGDLPGRFAYGPVNINGAYHNGHLYYTVRVLNRGVDVERHLRASVWLPHDDDYALLTLVVPITYAQAIFDSVPLIFLHGPAGSGKSETGRAMARVCANACVCGQSSAASIARFIDESRGFVVLDDLEVLGGRGGEFGELVQALKLSYNRETAVKLWTDVKTMRTMRLNFFGVKMINNTRGADDILGSRMLRIRTAVIPEQLREQFQGAAPTEAMKLRALRDELHTWTFMNVSEIDSEYRALYPKHADRAAEIAAPLRVMCALAGDEETGRRLEAALLRQRQKALEMDDPVKVMRRALDNLVAEGYETVSITHVALEMRYLLCLTLGSSFPAGFPEWTRPEWVGRKLRSEGFIDERAAGARRTRVWGLNLRFYPVSPSYLDRARRERQAQHFQKPADKKRPEEFCRVCEACQYRTVSCEIMGRRSST